MDLDERKNRGGGALIPGVQSRGRIEIDSLRFFFKKFT